MFNETRVMSQVNVSCNSITIGSLPCASNISHVLPSCSATLIHLQIYGLLGLELCQLAVT